MRLSPRLRSSYEAGMDDAYGTLRDESELARVSEIIAWCFHLSPEDARAWLERSGLEHVRVYRERGAPVACLLLIPMGQWFGGKSIPMVGVAAVGSLPEERGRGAAERLMAATLRELFELEFPLSALYPATRALYRRSGYELAGSRHQGTSRIAAIKVRASEPLVRRMVESDGDAVIQLYRSYAAKMNGFLDRSEYIWNRIRAPRVETLPRAYVVEGEEGLEGYFFVAQTEQADLRVTDQVMTTAAAARRTLSFFSHHWTMNEQLFVSTGPADPFALAFPEESFKSELWHHFMLRIVDVSRAFEARGYLEGVETEVELEVKDELIPENAGRFVLSIAEGQGHVRRGGGGALKLDVRGLAPLFTGHLAPNALRAAGLVEGDDRALARAALAFAGQAPWTPDGF
jgi:predicted acetyltransferase